MRKDFEVNCFPRPYGVAAYAVGYNLQKLRLPEEKEIRFPPSSNWGGLVARRIGGFESVVQVRDWCREHRYPQPETPCIPLMDMMGNTMPGSEGID